MPDHHAFFESLEPRQLLATYMVTNANDSGAGSLRQAISSANAVPDADTIEFDSALNGQAITLGGTALSITSPLSINGPGADLLTISANFASRVFSITAPGMPVSISGLTITQGHAGGGNGGGISALAALTIQSSVISDSAAPSGVGGAISSLASLTLIDSSVADSAAANGGGIHSHGTLTLLRTTVSGNSTTTSGAGLFITGGTAEVSNSTISTNTANQAGGGAFFNGTVTISNSTFASNVAFNVGAGIYNASSATVIRSSIVAGNTIGGAPSDVSGSAFAAGSTSNLIQDGVNAGGLTTDADSNLVGVDPLLAPLAFNGGVTRTHHLLDDSPALGAGSNPLSLSTDQRSGLFSRGTAVDIGAYQRQALALVVDLITDEQDSDYGAGDLSLREAIAAAGPNPGVDTISFAAALIGGTITLSGSELLIAGDLAIAGPGASRLTINADNASRVFNIPTLSPSTPASQVTISGLRISGGNAGDGRGGGILNAGVLALTDCVVTANTSAYGAGIFNENGGTLSLSGTTVILNNATGPIVSYGGGIYNGGELTLTNSTVSYNTTLNHGGGIYHAGASSVTLNGSTISDNLATGGSGGGIYVSTGSLFVTNSTISANSASSHGGGISTSATATIINSTISGNATQFGSGGGIYAFGTLSVLNSTISANSASSHGGGIYASAIATITNSTISGNATQFGVGGGIYAYGTLSVLNSTIHLNVAANASTGEGGGIFYNGGGSATLVSTIVSGSTRGDISGSLASGSVNNLIQDASAGGLTNGVNGNQLGVDPLLGSLALNGGPTATHALQSGSSAIGAGVNTTGLTTDQRGGPFTRGTIVDVGAFQRQSLSLIVDTTSDVHNNEYGVGDLSLREAIAAANANPGPDSITFAASLSGQSIVLGGTQLTVSDAISISGPGAGLLSINANEASRVFSFVAGSSSLSGLSITGGNAGGGDGGAILTVSRLVISDSHISMSTASRGGGISGTSTSELLITGSTISGNTAASGGGLHIAGSGDSALSISNSTISQNTATDVGGGMFTATGASVAVNNSTIVMNAATNSGGGIQNLGSTLSVRSTIVANNTVGGLPFDIFGTLGTDSTNNLVGDATNAGTLANGVNGNIVGVDPMLASLTSNGGSTPTHALQEGSPAIGAGINPLSLTTDQRGGVFGRGTAVDIGAYQRQTLALEVSTNWDAEDGNFGPGNLSLREALTATNANPGTDTITFRNTLNNKTIVLRGGELVVAGDTTITGPGASLLTISGNAISRIFFVTATATISGLTITGGNGAGMESGVGGGIYNSGTLTLTNLVIAQNAGYIGGGIWHSGEYLSLTGTVISGNESTSRGGGLAVGVTSSSGAVIIDSIVSENASIYGGGIYVDGVIPVNITNSTISGNLATWGGGLCGGWLSLMNSTVSGNNASYSGGGIYTYVECTLTNSALIGNSAELNGGGISSGAALTLSNSTVSGNSAGSKGGGIHRGGGPQSLSNSTITGNTAGESGGGIFSVASTTLTSSIVSGNTTSGSPSDIFGTLAVASAWNLIQDASSSGGLSNGLANNIIGVDPLLGPLADNGGPTLTHALLVGSPAINTGVNPGSLSTDQRGLARVRGTTIDIGAFEFSALPTIGTLGASAASVVRGQSITLTASGVADADGTIVRVDFYLDANADGIPDSGELIGSDTDATGGFAISYAVPAGATLGSTPLLAVAIDNDGLSSATSTTSVTITGTAFSIGSPVGAADAGNTHRIVSVNTLGQVLVYQQGWTSENLQTKTGAPAATSPAVLWVDPKDGLVYVAATSASGLILFTRSSTGTWSFRNLTAETGATGSPAGNLTQFTTVVNRIVIVAGITAAGKIVAFQQTLSAVPGGGPAFKFVDISADLAAQGQTTPQFASLISYVPKWDTWNLAGIDNLGNIQSVWINPRKFTRWRTDNLSVITGAAALAGQLTVTLTPWSAINLTGLNASGNVVTTWWIPRFKGRWANNNLTQEYSGSTLTGGNITGFVTPWGSINYIGINGSGQVTVYWWTPAQKWVVSLLVPATTPAASVPTGTLTSSASTAGTLNVYGTNTAGEVLRISWPKPVGKGWNIENLTNIAVEQ